MTRARPPLPGLPPLVLLPAYLLIALSPLALAWRLDLPPRPFLDELASALALVGFAMLVLEFVLSGRFKTISGHIGIDISMRFHQLMARSLLLFVLLHPFLYTLPLNERLPWDVSAAQALGIGADALVSGLLAWLLLPALVFWALYQRESRYRYETWRLWHGLGAGVIVALTLHHALTAGRYSGHLPLSLWWLTLTAVALLTLVAVYGLRPLAQLRRPYRVVSNRKIGLKTWELEIEPATRRPPLAADAIDFLPGQFVWLTLRRSPFSIVEHPFSISSAPAARPRIGFTIKEMGDFTNTIGSIPVGARAYLDGPHGHLVLAGKPARGLAFIAGGSGIAPIMSMLRALRAQRDPRPLRLIFGNRIAEQILYREELEAMREDLNLELDFILGEPPPGWRGRVGQLDIDSLRHCLASGDCAHWLYVVCGPNPMIDSVERSLAQLGVPLRQILSEKFTQL